MPYSGRTQRSYRGTFLSSTTDTMHFIFILFFFRGVNTESTHPQQTTDATTAVLSKDQSRDTVQELEMEKPQNVTFSCTMTGVSSSTASLNGYWKKNGVKIDGSNQTSRSDKQHLLKQSFFIGDLANYTCVFSISGSEKQATFVLKAPAIKQRDKPIVSYVGDSVILDCHMKHGNGPNTWKWYKVNGTFKELINETTDTSKYKIFSSNDTKLTVLNLTKEDAGKYACNGIYGIGKSEGQVELKVLSFTEPIKPFIAIAVEVVVLVTLILLYERHSQSRKRDSAENGPQPEQASKLTQDETNGVDGGTTTRQRKVD